MLQFIGEKLTKGIRVFVRLDNDMIYEVTSIDGNDININGVYGTIEPCRLGIIQEVIVSNESYSTKIELMKN